MRGVVLSNVPLVKTNSAKTKAASSIPSCTMIIISLLCVAVCRWVDQGGGEGFDNNMFSITQNRVVPSATNSAR